MREISKVIGQSEASISRKIRGEREFTLNDVRIICQHYRISAEEYFINEEKAGSPAEVTPKKNWAEYTLGDLKIICEQYVKLQEHARKERGP